MERKGMVVLCLGIALAASCRKEAPRSRAAETAAMDASKMAGLSALGYVGGAAPREQGAAKAASPAAVALKPPAGSASSFSSLKLIRTATLEVEVQDFTAAVDEATRTVTTLGGYVSDRQSSDDGQGHERGQITLRIPSGRFEGAVSAFRNLGRVRSEGVQTEDVTKAYADLETRLQVKREAAARLREILIRQTGKVSEVLAVEREIARVADPLSPRTRGDGNPGGARPHLDRAPPIGGAHERVGRRNHRTRRPGLAISRGDLLSLSHVSVLERAARVSPTPSSPLVFRT